MHPRVMLKKLIGRRIAELFGLCIVFSAIITLLNASRMVTVDLYVIVMISAFVLAFTIYNFVILRRSFRTICNKKQFYVLSLSSYAIFAGVNLLVFLFGTREIYAWLFSITKGLRIIGIDTIYSLLVFHCVQLLCIPASTIGLGWMVTAREEEEDEEYEEYEVV